MTIHLSSGPRDEKRDSFHDDHSHIQQSDLDDNFGFPEECKSLSPLVLDVLNPTTYDDQLSLHADTLAIVDREERQEDRLADWPPQSILDLLERSPSQDSNNSTGDRDSALPSLWPLRRRSWDSSSCSPIDHHLSIAMSPPSQYAFSGRGDRGHRLDGTTMRMSQDLAGDNNYDSSSNDIKQASAVDELTRLSPSTGGLGQPDCPSLGLGLHAQGVTHPSHLMWGATSGFGDPTTIPSQGSSGQPTLRIHDNRTHGTSTSRVDAFPSPLSPVSDSSSTATVTRDSSAAAKGEQRQLDAPQKLHEGRLAAGWTINGSTGTVPDGLAATTAEASDSSLDSDGDDSQVEADLERISVSPDPTKLRLPVRLPRPPLRVLSDPHQDLRRHLLRHGMRQEAMTFASAGMPADYILHGYMTAIHGGPPALLEQSSLLLSRHEADVARQMAQKKGKQMMNSSTGGGSSGISGRSSGLEASAGPPPVEDRLPESLHFDLERLDLQALKNNTLPTHVLAVHPTTWPPNGTKHDRVGQDSAPAGLSSSSSSSPPSSSPLPRRQRRAVGMLLPIHSLPYVLQCVSLPALPPADSTSTTGTKELPVVSVRVPRPDAFSMTHRWIYNHDSAMLLRTLIPAQVPLTGVLKVTTSSPSSFEARPDEGRQGTSASARAIFQHIVDHLQTNAGVTSSLPAGLHRKRTELLTHLEKVQAAWSNGLAIGVAPNLYWKTLERAWELLLGPLLLVLEEQKRAKHASESG